MAHDPDPVLARLERASSALVSDALDRLGNREHTLDSAIRPLRPEMRLAGRAVPVVVEATSRVSDDPYAGEMAALDSLEPGEVPVYAVSPGVRAALWGELFSCAAIGRGAVGAIVDGLVRDIRQIVELGYPTFARGASPLDTQGRASVTRHREAASCGGVVIHPGDYLVADEDGIVVVPAGLVDEVLGLVDAKTRDEDGARADLVSGASIFDVWERWRAL